MTDTDDDIVTRLRNPRWTVGGRDVLDDMDEAADEIERLRSDLAIARAEVAMLKRMWPTASLPIPKVRWDG